MFSTTRKIAHNVPSKNVIEVYENTPGSLKVIAKFTNAEDLLEYDKIHNLNADQISVNDCVLLGWDELYDFLN